MSRAIVIGNSEKEDLICCVVLNQDSIPKQPETTKKEIKVENEEGDPIEEEKFDINALKPKILSDVQSLCEKYAFP